MTEGERRILAAGLAAMQPCDSRHYEKPALRAQSMIVFFLVGILGWFLVGLFTLGLVGLLGVFAV